MTATRRALINGFLHRDTRSTRVVTVNHRAELDPTELERFALSLVAQTVRTPADLDQRWHFEACETVRLPDGGRRSEFRLHAQP